MNAVSASCHKVQTTLVNTHLSLHVLCVFGVLLLQAVSASRHTLQLPATLTPLMVRAWLEEVSVCAGVGVGVGVGVGLGVGVLLEEEVCVCVGGCVCLAGRGGCVCGCGCGFGCPAGGGGVCVCVGGQVCLAGRGECECVCLS